jgi:hypothetical protein
MKTIELFMVGIFENNYVTDLFDAKIIDDEGVFFEFLRNVYGMHGIYQFGLNDLLYHYDDDFCNMFVFCKNNEYDIMQAKSTIAKALENQINKKKEEINDLEKALSEVKK